MVKVRLAGGRSQNRAATASDASQARSEQGKAFRAPNITVFTRLGQRASRVGPSVRFPLEKTVV